MSDEATVLVLGDVVLDRLVRGDMTRISPEGPFPVVLSTGLTESPGGAANVALNIAKLGRRVQLIAIVGADAAGAILQQQLSATVGVWSRLVVAGDGGTITKTRLVCQGHQIVRLDDEAALAADAAIIAMFREAVAAAPIGAVVVSDYNKGTLSPAVLAELQQYCTASGVPVFVDAKPAKLELYRGVAIIKPNLAEALAAGNDCVHPALFVKTTPVEQAGVLAEHLRRKLRVAVAIVTCGPDGAVFSDPQQVTHVPTTPRHVYDVAGAGDTFFAALTVGLLDGRTLVDAVTWANLAAGLAVQEPGVVVIARDDVEDERMRLAGMPAKHMDLAELQEFVARAKRRGKRIVFTNGTFDLLHPGHIYLLDRAKREADVLVVAYNSDASVQRYKGLDRPLIPQDWRGVCLTMCGYCDAVIRFDEDTPETIIRAIRPDVLCKGAEFREQKVPGADFVASHGGRVVFVPMFLGFSTTAIKTKLDGSDDAKDQ